MIALRRVTAVASHLLGFVDREWGRWPPLPTPQPMVEAAHGTRSKDFVDRQRKELERVERFYNRVGNGQARILFFWGMAQGLVVLGVLTALAGVLAWLAGKLDGGQAHWSEIRLFALCVLAGALGAILSVLSRMASITGKFKLDHELGRKNVRWIGIYRSFVGGIFGFATFLILASGIGITQTPERGSKFAYYGILALFSGFFERFTKLSSTGSDEPASTEPSPAHATETPGHSER